MAKPLIGVSAMLVWNLVALSPLRADAQEVVYAWREAGRCTVRARTAAFPPGIGKREVGLTALCRYRPEGDSWEAIDLGAATTQPVHPDPNPPTVRSSRTDAELYDLTRLGSLADEPALIAVQWTEDGARSSAVLACGGVLCEDRHLGPAPPGKIAACLPARRSARALFVTDPEQSCFAGFDVPGADPARPRKVSR